MDEPLEGGQVPIKVLLPIRLAAESDKGNSSTHYTMKIKFGIDSSKKHCVVFTII